MKNLLFVFLIIASASFAQTPENKNTNAGMFSLGVRNTFSMFNEGSWGNPGTGVGGQFRIQLSDRVNTEWFADYITGEDGNAVHRTDYHIGWSVMFYLSQPREDMKIQPYLLAGHCFDYAKMQANADDKNYAERWSSAVQAGLGTHFNVSRRFDVSTTAQYMIHLGTDIQTSEENGAVIFKEENGTSLEGHILINISLNYKIAHLW
jgi:hypothetical protein